MIESMMMTTTTMTTTMMESQQWKEGGRFQTLSNEMKEMVSRILSFGVGREWTSLSNYGWELEEEMVKTIGEMIWRLIFLPYHHWIN